MVASEVRFESREKELRTDTKFDSKEFWRDFELELDKIVLHDILELSETEHSEVYQAVVDLVKSRLEKAKSVGEKASKKEGSLSVGLSENLMDDFCNGHD